MAQVQEVWNKLNPRERLTAIGAGVVLIGWIVGLLDYGFGTSTLALVGAVAVLVILFLKYSPNQSINWPAPVSLMILGISGIVALLAVIDALRILGLLRFGLGAYALAFILTAVGGVLMAWGAWQEYQIEKPAMPNFSGTGSTPSTTASANSAPPPTAPAAPAAPAEPPAAPAEPPAAPAPAADPEDRPPA